ncbi:SGNH hydrolase-type esterase domain-containing protein [Fomitopsis serialis]|uniref:SGNH hydrolase-type esterase domain-containing protein n=1 Tax=Fomitopsis serialis TaxID=139415 RepID=UPI002007B640|nr:SGNH hydrolase-type esterase domain-containing protein [Neoantrodia serialis]KAH9930895.1 SGNH hydrolase-type esterase domain-containing protein [Neoantrodia serialis]
MTTNAQDSIVLLGDSITQDGWSPYGFAQRLANAYVRKLDVINRGMSGYNTDWIIPIFEQSFAKQHDQQHLPKVRLLTIWLGANDAALPPSGQHVPLDRYASNLAQLVQLVASPSSPYHAPHTKLLLITPPPLNSHQWRVTLRQDDPPKELDRTFEVTAEYAERVRRVGTEVGVPVVDVWTCVWDAAGHVEERLSEYLYDGLHLNENGYALAYEEIIKAINDNYPELHYEKLQPVFKLWDHINPQNPGADLQKRNIFPA